MHCNEKKNVLNLHIDTNDVLKPAVPFWRDCGVQSARSLLEYK